MRFFTALTVFVAALALAPSAHAAWVWPLRGELISTYRNGDDPYAGGQHRGIDIAAPLGARVVAATGGEVRFAGVAGSSGLTVSVRTADGFDTSYLHLSSLAVRKGDGVDSGDVLGAVGTSGRRSAVQPHLHFGVREAGTRHAYRNPLDFLPVRARSAAGRRPGSGPHAAARARPAGPGTGAGGRPCSRIGAGTAGGTASRAARWARPAPRARGWQGAPPGAGTRSRAGTRAGGRTVACAQGAARAGTHTTSRAARAPCRITGARRRRGGARPGAGSPARAWPGRRGRARWRGGGGGAAGRYRPEPKIDARRRTRHRLDPGLCRPPARGGASGLDRGRPQGRRHRTTRPRSPAAAAGRTELMTADPGVKVGA